MTNAEAWVVPVTRVTISDALYLHTPRSDFKVGGEMALATTDQDSHVYENGFFEFQTDAPFDPREPGTWPIAYNQQKPVDGHLPVAGNRHVRAERLASRQSDSPQRRPALRHRSESAAERLLSARRWTIRAFEGLDRFISRDRGTDTNNLQPRLGATWDSRGDGTLIVRGGWGVYVTRNRPGSRFAR